MGERLADVLKRAGGIRQEGYLRAARFLRQSVRERQILARDEYIAQERSRLESLKVEITQQEIDDKERKRSLSGVDQVTTLVDRLAGSDILGRIQLDFRGVSTLEEIKISEMNISLEDGDVFEVPGIPSEVTILGQVYSPSTVLHRKNLKLNDFLSLAGGFTEFAHKESIYILKADGSATPARKARTKTRSLAYVKGALSEGSSSYQYVVEPGDTIVVPAKLRMRHDRFQRTLDAVYKSAISVGALAGLFK
jgi:protein involved in polysaccharide export with SLBB domain